MFAYHEHLEHPGFRLMYVYPLREDVFPIELTQKKLILKEKHCYAHHSKKDVYVSLAGKQKTR